MTKAQVCRHMACHFEARARATGRRPLTRDDAREFLEELRRLCVRELSDGGRFSIPKVAKLVVETRRQRRGTRPRHRDHGRRPGASHRAGTSLSGCARCR